jgi:transcriptional regulator with XRE-family HTH domain
VTLGAESQSAVARKTGIDQATISRWLNNSERVPSPRAVVRFARAYDVNALEALIAAGVITESEAQLKTSTHVDLSTVSTSALAAELTRRAESSAA